MKLLVIEGADGTGKSTHAARLVAALTARDVAAQLFTHPRPPAGAGVVEAAFHFAGARMALARRVAPNDVVVADRWYWSTLLVAQASGQGPAAESLREIVAAERRVLPEAMGVVKLDAADDVLDSRLSLRGETVDAAVRAVRAEYRAWRVPKLATSFDEVIVAEHILRAALDVLGVSS